MSALSKNIVSGVLLLDKPIGLSSHTAVSRVKRLFQSDEFNSKKAGHTGTLDPMATGLLPICFGDATKFSQYGLDAVKGYTAVIKLGIQTDTGDKEGCVVGTKEVPKFDETTLACLAKELLGEQLQVPPMYSALKKDGKKLYEYARAGVEVERKARPITIFAIELKRLSVDEITLSVRCSKGTYVRVLGETIAQRLGTVGHLSALHRTYTGDFDVADAVSLEMLTELTIKQRFAYLLPVDAMISHFDKLSLDEHETKRVFLGQRLNVKDRLVQADKSLQCWFVRLYHQACFIGLGEVDTHGRLQPKKMIANHPSC